MTLLQKTMASTLGVLVGVAVYRAYQGQNGTTASSAGTGAAPPMNLTGSAGAAGEMTPEIRSLLADVQSSKTETRLFAIKAIGNLGPKGREAVPTLAKLLRDKDKRIRILTAHTLGKIGPDAKDALPALRKYAETWRPAERSTAKTAIKRIDI
jgi:hypothetical protein